jgi:hypothetical protein
MSFDHVYFAPPPHPLQAAASKDARFHNAEGDVRRVAPIYDPEKVICIGMNYVGAHRARVPPPTTVGRC